MLFLPIVLAFSSAALVVGDYTNLVFKEDFSKGLDFSIWKHEIVSKYTPF